MLPFYAAKSGFPPLPPLPPPNPPLDPPPNDPPAPAGFLASATSTFTGRPSTDCPAIAIALMTPSLLLNSTWPNPLLLPSSLFLAILTLLIFPQLAKNWWRASSSVLKLRFPTKTVVDSSVTTPWGFCCAPNPPPFWSLWALGMVYSIIKVRPICSVPDNLTALGTERELTNLTKAIPLDLPSSPLRILHESTSPAFSSKWFPTWFSSASYESPLTITSLSLGFSLVGAGVVAFLVSWTVSYSSSISDESSSSTTGATTYLTGTAGFTAVLATTAVFLGGATTSSSESSLLSSTCTDGFLTVLAAG